MKGIKSLRETLDYVGKKEQQMILDSLACTFHNEGYFLKGNTQESDAVWFARQMWNAANGYHEFDRQPQEVQDEWTKMAGYALQALPAITERIADRYIAASKAIRSMEVDMRKEFNL